MPTGGSTTDQSPPPRGSTPELPRMAGACSSACLHSSHAGRLARASELNVLWRVLARLERIPPGKGNGGVIASWCLNNSYTYTISNS